MSKRVPVFSKVNQLGSGNSEKISCYYRKKTFRLKFPEGYLVKIPKLCGVDNYGEER